jgi:uncharacterized protein
MRPLILRRLAAAAAVLLLLLPWLLFAPCASAASFDCAKARSQVEKLICADDTLSRLDDELGAAYQQALKVSTSRTALVEWQREWLRSDELTRCRKTGCVASAFMARIEILKHVAPDGDAASRWTGRYVRWHKGRDDANSARLLLVGLTGQRVHLSGSAIWLGAKAADGEVNTGDMQGIGTVTTPASATPPARLTFDQNGCRAELALKADGLLVVEQDSGCGGLNVSFVGEYRRR